MPLAFETSTNPSVTRRSSRPGANGKIGSWLRIVSFLTSLFPQAVIAVLVQFFFAWRVKVLTSNRWIVGGIVLCAVTQLCMPAVCHRKSEN